MDSYEWTRHFRVLYDKAVALYKDGKRDARTYFTPEETAALASIGLRPIHVYDFAEDFVRGGEPDWDTALLITAARRDYFLYEQHGQTSVQEIHESDLPQKTAELGGIVWLPRIIRKAQCFLDGGLCHNIMFCCGGDRAFLKKHRIHPADFLRITWAARGDEQKIFAYVRKAANA